MNTSKFYKILAIATFIIAIIITLVVLSLALIDAKKQQKIFQENLYQSLNERDQQILLQSEKDIAKYFPLIQAQIDSLKIKHITQVHQTNYYYSTDSVITVLVPTGDSIPCDSITWYHKRFAFNLDTLCLNIEGIADVENKQLLFTKLSLRDMITTFYFWQRQRLFNWKWTPKWGKKQYRAKSISNCTDSISTLDIKINKQ